jgi:hypothetical protein
VQATASSSRDNKTHFEGCQLVDCDLWKVKM